MANILIIEDMKGVQASIATILTGAGHKITTADNGKLGIEAQENGAFDLIITDILMSEMDGSEVLFALQKKTPKPPVIAISAGGALVSATEALQFAKSIADAVLVKPFSRSELLTTVDGLIEKQSNS